MPEINRILKENAFHLVDFEIANEEQDLSQATDMILSINGDATIAVRLRRPYYNYRDLTLRAWRSGGIATELHKVQQGFATYYLYGWTAHNYTVPEWILVDMNQLRDSGLLEAQTVIYNRDGRTGFIAIPYKTLCEYQCLLAGIVDGQHII